MKYPLRTRLFAILIMIGIASWTLPASFAGASGVNQILVWNDRTVRPAVTHFLLWTGLFQTWNMFIHKPGQANIWRDTWFEVELKRGGNLLVSKKIPRVRDMPILEWSAGFRYRKFLDYANPQVAPQLLKPLVIFFAKDQGVPMTPLPEHADLVQYLKQIPKYGEPWPANYSKYVVYSYDFKPEDWNKN